LFLLKIPSPGDPVANQKDRPRNSCGAASKGAANQITAPVMLKKPDRMARQLFFLLDLKEQVHSNRVQSPRRLSPATRRVEAFASTIDSQSISHD
jgi:hypothetical protein